MLTKLILASLLGLLAPCLCAAQSLLQIETQVLEHLEKIGKFSNYGGERDYNALERENKALHSLLIRFGSRADVLRHPFTKAREKMFITTSKDGRLRAYSWDAETGGSMHDFFTVYQYLDNKDRAHASADGYDVEESGGAFVHDIFQLDTGPGRIYLPVTTFIGSTSLAGAAIYTYTIEGSKLNRSVKLIRTASGDAGSISFQYDFFSVVDRPERPIKLFRFDPVRKAFSFPVVIEDEKTPQGRVTNRMITYRFNGSQFVKVS